MNRVEITGRLSRDPTTRWVGQTQNFPIVELNVAVDDGVSKWDRESQIRTVGSGFYKVEIPGDYGLVATKRLQKGDLVYVVGSLSQFQLKAKEGQEYGETKTSIRADLVVAISDVTGRQPPSRDMVPEPVPDVGEEPF